VKGGVDEEIRGMARFTPIEKGESGLPIASSAIVRQTFAGTGHGQLGAPTGKTIKNFIPGPWA
jgi:hypothetical protein